MSFSPKLYLFNVDVATKHLCKLFFLNRDVTTAYVLTLWDRSAWKISLEWKSFDALNPLESTYNVLVSMMTYGEDKVPHGENLGFKRSQFMLY